MNRGYLFIRETELLMLPCVFVVVSSPVEMNMTVSQQTTRDVYCSHSETHTETEQSQQLPDTVNSNSLMLTNQIQALDALCDVTHLRNDSVQAL